MPCQVNPPIICLTLKNSCVIPYYSNKASVNLLCSLLFAFIKELLYKINNWRLCGSMIVRGSYPTYTEFLHPKTVTKLAVRTVLCVYFCKNTYMDLLSTSFFFFLFSSSMWKSSSNLKVCQKLSWASLSLWASVNITFVRLTNYKVNFSDD